MAKSHSPLSIAMLCFLVLLPCGSFVTPHTTPVQDDDLEMMKIYEEWMFKYNRIHTTLTEKNQRFKIFKDNVKRINAHNNVEGRRYDLAINKFADMTSEEFNAKYTGYRPRSTNENVSCRPQNFELLSDIPSSIDWRNKGAVTSVKDQMECLSCWAFAVIGALEGMTQIKTGKLIDLSPQELVDCHDLNYGCEGGLLDTSYTWITNNKGLNSEYAYPYTGAQGTCDEQARSVSVVNITGYECVQKYDEKALAAAVSSQPVAVSINANDNLRFYNGGVFDNNREFCDPYDQNHSVVAVGYGTLEDGTPYWILKNSWGEEWGEGGYVRMLKDIDAKEGMCGITIDGTYPVI